MHYTDRVLEELTARYAHQAEFLQAAQEIMASLKLVVDTRPEIEKVALLERLFEPERSISFRVTWIDDHGKVQVNHGLRVQFNSALGPFKGGLRFHPSVNESIVRFLALEQTLKNALTGLPMGGAKGGADFNPRGKSNAEIMRFCQRFMTELSRHIGPNTDIPAGDIGVGQREIGYLYGHYKRMRNETTGAMTGKSPIYGGSLGRREATGHGLLYLVKTVLENHGRGLDGQRVIVSGSGNVAYFAAKKAESFGAKVIAMSDSDGWILDEEGIKLDIIDDIKNTRRARISEYQDLVPGSVYTLGRGIWHVPCDIALPCATQNEVHLEDAKALVKNGCYLLAEGANMPTTIDAVKYLNESKVLYVPGKASNAGGVAVSGLEMTQNAQHLAWTGEEVDMHLQQIMAGIYDLISMTAKEYGQDGNYEFGANAAGFMRVAEAMIALGY